MSTYRRKVQLEDIPSDNDQSDIGAQETSDDHDPFAGAKVRRNASMAKAFKGDYIDVPSHPYLTKILEKQGDRGVLFADKVLKFNGSGKMKRQIIVVTNLSIYVIDPESYALKRRVALAAVERLCLSQLSDNFVAVIVPTEYDLLIASTRKTEIVSLLVESMKSTSNYELEVNLSNSFEYRAASDRVKEIQFEEVEGGTKTRIVNK